MKLRIVPASQGLVWFKQGLQLARRQPLNLVGLLGLIASAVLLLMGLPILGPIVVVAAMPLAWMGFMVASRRALGGERITPSVLIEPVRGQKAAAKAFAQLGAAYVVATLLVMQLAQMFGPGADVLADAFENAKDTAELVGNPLVLQDLLWRLGLTAPVSLLFWHTPALISWARLPVGQSLFYSAVASWRNLSAFMLYGICWMGLIGAVGLFDQLLVVVLPVPFLSGVLTAAAGMWAASAFYASLYFTVVDCFDASSTSAQAEPEV